MQPLFILESGFLGRLENTLHFENINVKRKFPIKDYDSIYLLGEISFNTKLFSYNSYQQIPMFFFSYYGNYAGCFFPNSTQNVSGKTLINQVLIFTDPVKRLILAREIIISSIHNMRKTLLQYKLKFQADLLKTYYEKINTANSINKIMSFEANARKYYYKQFNKIIKNEKYFFYKRSFHPPEDKINCLLSFGNSLLYSTLLSEMFKTKLNPLISIVHEPSDNRFSLQLDLADIFKPIIVDRVIFSLINQNMLNDSDFEFKENFCYLNKEGKKKFIQKYDLKLKDTIKVYNEERFFSYKLLLRKECLKLVNLIESNSNDYKGFRMWW